jgi:ribosomal protein S18 acetylase RimI-like enzyme
MAQNQGELTVRPLSADEAGAYAGVHRAVFPEYNSSKLGQWFCARFYRRYAARGEALGFGVWRQGQLLGLVVGCPRAVETDIRRELSGYSFCAGLVRPWVLLDGSVVRRTLRHLKSCLSGSQRPRTDDTGGLPIDGTWVRLVNIGVLSTARGLGVGTLLMAAFRRESVGRKYRFAELSVLADNRAARQLYEKQGWKAADATLPDDTVLYWTELRAEAEASAPPPAKAAP